MVVGKYPNSSLHAWFSDWHIKMCRTSSYLTDVDRLWVEMRGQEPIAAFDLKFPDDEETWAEQIIHDWFETHNVPYYILIVSKGNNGTPCAPFTVKHGIWEMQFETEKDLADWIDSGLSDSIFDIQLTSQQVRNLQDR